VSRPFRLVRLVLFAVTLTGCAGSTGSQSGGSTPVGERSSSAGTPSASHVPGPSGSPSSSAGAEGPETTTDGSGSASPSAQGGSRAQPAPRTLAGLDISAHSTSDPASIWVVVNKGWPLRPRTYAPTDLRSAGNGEHLRAAAASALLGMVAAAGRAGMIVRADSGYRSYAYQVGVHASAVSRLGQGTADEVSARAGYSEHQTGWGVDLGTPGCDIARCFADTAAGRWTAAHAFRYGLVLRYPPNGQDRTGYSWEPWHYRYVGRALATAMHATHATYLERAFGLPSAPTYR